MPDELYPYEDLIECIHDLAADGCRDFWELGRLMDIIMKDLPSTYGKFSLLKRTAFLQQYGCGSTNQFYEEVLGIKTRTAQNIIQIYRKFVIELKVSESRMLTLANIGRAKLYLIAKVVDEHNLSHWIDQAKRNNHEQLTNIVMGRATTSKGLAVHHKNTKQISSLKAEAKELRERVESLENLVAVMFKYTKSLRKGASNTDTQEATA